MYINISPSSAGEEMKKISFFQKPGLSSYIRYILSLISTYLQNIYRMGINIYDFSAISVDIAVISDHVFWCYPVCNVTIFYMNN